MADKRRRCSSTLNITAQMTLLNLREGRQKMQTEPKHKPRLRSPLRISPKLSGFLPKIESTIKPNRKFSFFPKRKQSYNINRRTTTTVFRYDRKNSELLVSKCSTIERPGHNISSKTTQRHSLTSRTKIVDDMCADHRTIIPTEGIPMYTNGSRYC